MEHRERFQNALICVDKDKKISFEVKVLIATNVQEILRWLGEEEERHSEEVKGYYKD